VWGKKRGVAKLNALNESSKMGQHRRWKDRAEKSASSTKGKTQGGRGSIPSGTKNRAGGQKVPLMGFQKVPEKREIVGLGEKLSFERCEQEKKSSREEGQEGGLKAN